MKRLPSILAVGALVAVLAACNGSSGGLGSVPPPLPTASNGAVAPDLTPVPSDAATPASSTATSEAPGSSASATTASASPATNMIVRAYFVLGGQPGSTGLVPVLRDLPSVPGVAAAAMNALLAGPTTTESSGRTITTAIPAGTRLLGVTIKNGVSTVNLSTEFDSGGGASMPYRLAQVAYTLTQFSAVKSVVFQIEGQTVTVFGSEGIVLNGPVGRADYTDQLPAIFVDRSAYGAALGNPGRVAGNANVFEATFRVAVIDAGGKTLLDQQVTATCGTGCRGTFDVTVRYAVSKGQWGTLRVYDASAKDGSPENVREYPAWLTPAN